MLLADEYNIAEKPSVYKENKRCWLKCGGKHYAGNTAKLNGNYQLESIEKEYGEIDFARDAKIYVQYKIYKLVLELDFKRRKKNYYRLMDR